MSLKAKIEAVLFLTDKPMRAAGIARIVNEDVQLVRQTLLELIHEYEARAGALEIAQENGYIIQVKDDFAQIIEEFLPIEMSAALVRTLSAIAIKQPVAQSEIIKVRGAGAYDHIKELINRDLIHKKEEGGRSPILTTTKKFQEYFRLTRDARSLRQQLKKTEKTGQLQIDGAPVAAGGEGADPGVVEGSVSPTAGGIGAAPAEVSGGAELSEGSTGADLPDTEGSIGTGESGPEAVVGAGTAGPEEETGESGSEAVAGSGTARPEDELLERLLDAALDTAGDDEGDTEGGAEDVVRSTECSDEQAGDVESAEPAPELSASFTINSNSVSETGV